MSGNTPRDVLNDKARLDIVSAELERFLRSEQPRRYSPSERLRRIRAIFGKPEEEEREPDLEELHPYRIMALWRTTRLIMELKERLAEDERLEDATLAEPSPWDHPTKPVTRTVDNSPRRGHGGLLALLREGEGTPILCPNGGELVRPWCNATGMAAQILGLGGSEVGQKGTVGLLDPTVAPYCCPTAEQLMAFEDRLIHEAVELMVEHGEPAIIDHYRHTYHMTRRESVMVVRLARTAMAKECSAPVEENRAMAIRMLKQFISEVSETPNMRDRLLAIKELVRVQGITREAPEDAMTDMLNVVRQISQRREQKENEQGHLLLGTQDVGEGGSFDEHATDAAFEVVDDDDDRDALAAYDAENR